MINFKYIFNKIKNKKCKIGVIGLGYVGLPLSVLIAKKLKFMDMIKISIK